MKKALFLVLSFVSIISIVVSSITIAGQETPPTGYTGPIANRPVFVPGEYWIFEKKDGSLVKWEFLREEGGLLVFQSGKRKDLLYTDRNRVATIKQIHGETGEIIYQIKRDVNWLRMEFPLWVGKRWNFSFEERRQNSFVLFDVDWHVISYDDIKVKNGTLKAFRIERYWRTRNRGKDRSYTFYYIPDLKIFITEESSQLVEFKINNWK